MKYFSSLAMMCLPKNELSLMRVLQPERQTLTVGVFLKRRNVGSDLVHKHFSLRLFSNINHLLDDVVRVLVFHK